MKKIKLIVVFLFTILLVQFNIVNAADKWTAQDIALETTWQVLHIVDWGTTLNIADNPKQYREYNPILGTHPSRGTVNIYMASGAILHPIISHLLPREVKLWNWKIPARTLFQSITIGTTGACVANNLAIGLKIDF